MHFFPKFINIFCSFRRPLLANETFQTRRWVFSRNVRDKWFWTFFTAKLEKFFWIFQFFLQDFFIKKARKLEVAEWNPIMKNIPVDYSLSVRIPFLSRSLFIVFSFYLSLSLSLSLPLFWCRTLAAVMWRNVIISDPH